MDGPDLRDVADIRLRGRAELGDLAEAAHSHLDDRGLGVGLQATERERQADLVVLAPSATTARACGPTRAPRMSFVDVFAVDPVIATTRAGAALADRPRERRQRSERVLRDERRGGSARERVSGKLGSAPHRDEEVAGAHVGASRPLEAGRLSGAVRPLELARGEACRLRRA